MSWVNGRTEPPLRRRQVATVEAQKHHPQKLDSSPHMKEQTALRSQKRWRECSLQAHSRLRLAPPHPRIVVPRLGCHSALLWLQCTSRTSNPSSTSLRSRSSCTRPTCSASCRVGPVTCDECQMEFAVGEHPAYPQRARDEKKKESVAEPERFLPEDHNAGREPQNLYDLGWNLRGEVAGRYLN